LGGLGHYLTNFSLHSHLFTLFIYIVNLSYAKVKPVLCKNSANRTQSSWLGIAEVKPVLCKGIDFLMNTKGWNVKYDRKISHTTPWLQNGKNKNREACFVCINFFLYICTHIMAP